jgi:hypothetical protein
MNSAYRADHDFSDRSRRARASIGAALLFFAVLAFATAACTVTLIGDYDETIDKGVTDVQQKAELYLSKLQSDPNTAYDQSFYDDINSRLAVLKTRAAALEKYAIIGEQLGNLQSQFDDLQKLDKSMRRPFPRAAVVSAQSALEVSVESILKLELALKRGASPPAPATK